MEILVYKKRGDREINKKYLPDIKSDKIMIQYLVRNI